MKAITKVTFYNNNEEKFFGEGPAQLLYAIEKEGSLRAAALSMHMAYTKALKILKQAEESLGYPLTTRICGGKDGGGSNLTPEGKAWLTRYEAYRDACIQANQKLYQEFFPEKPPKAIGCVILASGLGTRFGGNKLMADFCGSPLISRILDVTEGLFSKRVVVTRHEEVVNLCKSRGVDVIFHDLPHRSDTVRLGLEAIGAVDGCLFCPADQPLLRCETITALLHAFADRADCIWRTCWNETPGSPVLFPAWAFPELSALPEGKGGGFVIANHSKRVVCLPVTDPYELMDADTPEALALLEKQRLLQTAERTLP